MSGLAGIINWDGSPVSKELIDEMINIVSHRGPDGINTYSHNNVGFGHAHLSITKCGRNEKQPFTSPDKSMTIVSNSSLYNKDELTAKLGHVEWATKLITDPKLILAGYIKWGPQLLDYLDGEYAFAIWDEKKKRIFAARDPFGTVPLYYSSDNKYLYFASEPKQIIKVSNVSPEPDKTTIAQYILRQFNDSGRSFYKQIKQIKPGHYLLASRSETKEIQYWNPDPTFETQYKTKQDYIEQYKELLRASVYKCIQSDYPIASQLSGGLDSSSIVVTAQSLYHTHDNLPPLHTISATYEDLPCDESEYIRLVSDLVQFENHRFCPIGEFNVDNIDEEIRQTDSPFAEIQQGIFANCSQIMDNIGGKILLTGIGGDELADEAYYLRDLAKRFQYLELLLQSWNVSNNNWATFWYYTSDALRSTVPKPLRQIYRAILKPKTPNVSVPNWANSELTDLIESQEYSKPHAENQFNSLTQGAVFEFLNSPQLHWLVDTFECRAAYAGFRMRHPYLDRKLAEYVMSIPFNKRVPDGKWKYLTRTAFRGTLPEQIIENNLKTAFDSINIHLIKENFDNITNKLFNKTTWHLEPYIGRDNAHELFREYRDNANNQTWTDTYLLWRIATMELLLRQ